MQPNHATPRLLLPVLCAAAVFAITLGARQSLALFIGPLNTATGVGIAGISLAFGIGQLMWGVTQPIAGLAADRWGNARVLIAGTLMIALGTALTPFAQSSLALILTIGVLSAGGAGAAGPAVLMAAINRILPPERRGMASGLVNAGGSFGQFALVPTVQFLMSSTGWVNALLILAAMALAVIPLSRVLWQPAGHAGTGHVEHSVPVARAVREPNFALLSAGFFVCGFHVAFIAPTCRAWSPPAVCRRRWAHGRWR